MPTVWQDLRYGLRMLAKSPGFTAVAILTLALGIGANTAIFSVVDAILLRPLPYPHPDRLVTISESNLPNDAATRNVVAPANFLDWRQRNDVFEEMAAANFPGFALTGTDRPERVLGAAISAGALHMLGLHPALGREFNAEEDRPGASPVAMLSYALWQRRFAARSSLVSSHWSPATGKAGETRN
jgi:putative ABC transport system permease protein